MPLATWVTDSTYLNATPYLTIAEFRQAPTRLDTEGLVTGASYSVQDAELANVIARASSWVDEICDQTLAATSNTEDAWVTVKANGYAVLSTRYWPVLELTAVALGPSPSTTTTLNVGADVRIGRQTIEVPVARSALFGVGSPFGRFACGDRLYARWTYVNGWPNTLLAGDVIAGGTSLPLVDPTGVYAGTQLRIYDRDRTEMVTVSAITGSTATVAPLAYDHSPANIAGGLAVSALPAAVKQATILIASAMLKAPGDMAVVMPSLGGQPQRTQAAEPDTTMDLLQAEELLRRYRRVGW